MPTANQVFSPGTWVYWRGYSSTHTYVGCVYGVRINRLDVWTPIAGAPSQGPRDGRVYSPDYFRVWYPSSIDLLDRDVYKVGGLTLQHKIMARLLLDSGQDDASSRFYTPPEMEILAMMLQHAE